MYKISQHEGAVAQRVLTSRPPMGIGLAPEKAAEFDRLEIWGTDYSDPGADFCEFRVFRKDEETCTVYTVPGY